MLGVARSTLGAQIVEARAQIIVLRNRVTGKQVGKKTPVNIRTQRELDLAQLARLEESLPVMVGTHAGLNFRVRELGQALHEKRVKERG